MQEENYTLDIPSRIERRRKALTVKEVAELVSLSTKQIYELVAGGHIPSYRIAGAIRFDPRRTAEWLRLQHS
jgi:excisionase family DNA binding protein